MTQTTFKQDVLPWYKHRWPWLLMAGPAIVIVAGMVTAVLAVKSWDGLVSDDYYKQGLGINQVKTRDQNAVTSGVSVQITYSGVLVQAFLHGNTTLQAPEKLTLKLVHPTRNGMDQTVELVKQGAGFYRGTFTTEPAGRFNALLEDEKGEWRLTGPWHPVTVDEPVVLKPATQALQKSVGD
ncbi:MAG: hypothetical protein RIR18_2340 [Pseudomonadota bacterium]|jgi:hypothetical protein